MTTSTAGYQTAYEPRIEEIAAWARELEDLHARIASHLERVELR